MIRADSLPTPYRSEVRSETHMLISDAPVAKGGGGDGFGAHQLLEAALASCINMAIRMHADQNAIPLDRVSTRVWLSKPDDCTTCFSYAVEIIGDINEAQRAQLEEVPETCPVRQTLSRNLEFVRGSA